MRNDTLQTCVIDDDPESIYLSSRVLKKCGRPIEIITFHNAETALQHLAQCPNRLDIIFLDINMPEINGFDFLDRFRRCRPDTHVVMLSTSDDNQDKKRASAYEAVSAYVSKPLTSRRVHELTDSLLCA